MGSFGFRLFVFHSATESPIIIKDLLADFFLSCVDLAGASAVAVVSGAGLAVAAGPVFVVRKPVSISGQALAGETTELKRNKELGRGCGAVDRVVALDTRDPWFESRHQQ